MRFTRIIGAAAVMLLATAATAAAHVEFTPSGVSTDDATLVTLTVPHDCNGQGTTSLEMQVPKQVTTFTPVDAAGWTIKTTTSASSGSGSGQMADMHAGNMGEHVDTVTWTHDGGPLPHGTAAALQAIVTIDPKTKADDMIHLPTIQNCPGGQKTSWIDTPAKGESMEDLEHPAPMLTAASEEDGGSMAMSKDTSSSTGTAVAAKAKSTANDAKDSADSARTLGVIGILLGAIALLVAFAGRRKKG